MRSDGCGNVWFANVQHRIGLYMWCLHNILSCFCWQILEYVHANRTEYSTQLYGMSPSLVMNKMLADMLLCRLFYILECKMQCVPARHWWKMLYQHSCSHTKRKYTLPHAECEPPMFKISKVTVWTVIFMATFKGTVHLYNDINFETPTEVLCILS